MLKEWPLSTVWSRRVGVIVVLMVYRWCVAQERREREQQELESAKEMADEDFDGFA